MFQLSAMRNEALVILNQSVNPQGVKQRVYQDFQEPEGQNFLSSPKAVHLLLGRCLLNVSSSFKVEQLWSSCH